MPDEPQPAPETPPESEEKILIRGSDLSAILFGVPVFVIIIGSAVLNICAAMGWWNPLHWRGRFWTGVLLLAVPTVMVIVTTLPAKVRTKLPDSVAEITVLLLWVAFFWAACGGH